MTTSLPGAVDRAAARDAVSPSGRKLSRLAVDKLGNVLSGFIRHGGRVRSSAVVVLVGGHRCERQSRLREYEEHFDGSARGVETDPPKVGQAGASEIVV